MISSQTDRDTLQEHGATFDLNDLVQIGASPEKMQSGSGLGIVTSMNCIFCCCLFLIKISFALDQPVSSGSGNNERNSSDGPSGNDNSLLLLASKISVQLPAEVFTNVTEDSAGLLYSLYLTSSLFPIATDSRSEGFTVGSPVVGAAVSGRNISNLASPIVITLPITSVEVNRLIWCSWVAFQLSLVTYSVQNWIVGRFETRPE